MNRIACADPREISRQALLVSLALSVATLLSLGSLHILSPEFDPTWRVVSEYALGKFGWALAILFLSWAFGSWALAMPSCNSGR